MFPVFNRIVVLGFCLSVATPAAAQIYSWRDAEGKLVLSERPPSDGNAKVTYAVSGSSTVRSTTHASDERSAPYEQSIVRHAGREGVAPDLVRAVIQVESAFNPMAVSSKGAMGLMQLMPATARELGVNNPFDSDQNIRGGVTYLRRLLDRYNGDVELALAAYNAGMGNVEKYGDVPPFRETQNYVKKVTEGRPVTPPRNVIYKWMELVDGRPTMRFSNVPPPTGAYEVVAK